MELKKATAIITGASGHLGGATAKALAEAGCNCICHYNRNEHKTEQLVEQICKTGAKALAVKADLNKPDEIENLFEESKELGTPQILINSAAIFSRQPLENVTFEEAQKILNLNLTAPILISKEFAKGISSKLHDTDGVIGKIINISDVGGIRGWAEYVLYCSSKAGLIGATKALAKELAPSICVNSIAPGIVTWPSDFSEPEKQHQLSFIPAKRIAQLNEITGAIIFLLENDYITGQVLNVDGGRCI
jgi:NAD(P)-dependent dehydrogenase (short-subunit alcohol dehydrogenase family)